MASIRTRTLPATTPTDNDPTDKRRKVRAKPEQRYDVVWRDHSGKQHTKTFTRKAQATQFKATVEADLARGTYIDPNAGNTLLRDEAATWLKDRQGLVNDSTLAANELRLRVHITPVLGDLRLNQIGDAEIRRWLRTISHLATSTQNAIYTDLKAVLAMAVKDKKILTNPLSDRSLRPVKRREPDVVPWSGEWVHDVIDTIDPRYRLIPVLAAGLGLRQGECFGLAVEDVDFLRNTVTVRRQVKIMNPGSRLAFGPPKYGTVRTVPLPDSVKTEMNRHLANYSATEVTLPWIETGKPPRDETAVLFFTSREAKPLNRNTWNGYVWKPTLQANGIPSRREDRNGLHALRHYFASVLLDAGESIKTLSKFLGHSDPAFTMRVYTHLMPAAEVRSRAVIDAAFQAAEKSACDMDVRSDRTDDTGTGT